MDEILKKIEALILQAQTEADKTEHDSNWREFVNRLHVAKVNIWHAMEVPLTASHPRSRTTGITGSQIGHEGALMADVKRNYAGACWNALMEEETKESIAELYIDLLAENHNLKSQLAASRTECEELRKVLEDGIALMEVDGEANRVGTDSWTWLNRARALASSHESAATEVK